MNYFLYEIFYIFIRFLPQNYVSFRNVKNINVIWHVNINKRSSTNQTLPLEIQLSLIQSFYQTWSGRVVNPICFQEKSIEILAQKNNKSTSYSYEIQLWINTVMWWDIYFTIRCLFSVTNTNLVCEKTMPPMRLRICALVYVLTEGCFTAPIF